MPLDTLREPVTRRRNAAHVVMFSGGIGSWAAAKRVAERYGTDDLTLLFTDTKIEDRDLYRFLNVAARNVFQNAPMDFVRIAEGRTPWQVFRDHKMIGNTRADLCSRILKREPGDRWLAENCDPASTTVYLGIDWTEAHRFDNGKGAGAKHRYARLGYRCEAPLCEPPYITKRDMLRLARENALQPSRAYEVHREEIKPCRGQARTGRPSDTWVVYGPDFDHGTTDFLGEPPAADDAPGLDRTHSVNDEMIADAYRRGLRVRGCRSLKLKSLNFLLD